jgi:hypothetical protein
MTFEASIISDGSGLGEETVQSVQIAVSSLSRSYFHLSIV